VSTAFYPLHNSIAFLDRISSINESYDDSPWTVEEMAFLAGEAFDRLEEIDYSEYLKD